MNSQIIKIPIAINQEGQWICAGTNNPDFEWIMGNLIKDCTDSNDIVLFIEVSIPCHEDIILKGIIKDG